MKKISLIILAIIISLYSLLYIHVKNVQAINIGLGIHPALVKVVIRPGKNITQVIKIDNRSTDNKTLVARLVPFTSADDFGNPNIDPRTTAPWLEYFSLANSKIQFDQPFELKAGQSDQLILSISIPAEAPLGDLYATLLVTSYATGIDNQLQGSALSATIGSNLLISVSTQGAPSTILKITDLLPEEGKYLKIGDYYFLDNITPLYFTALAKNEGEFTAETKGVFRIERNEQNPIELQSVLPQYVLAKSQRRLGTISDSKFFFTPGFSMIGPHAVRIDIRSENSNASTKIDVIFFPGKILIGIIAAIIFLRLIIRISTSQNE